MQVKPLMWTEPRPPTPELEYNGDDMRHQSLWAMSAFQIAAVHEWWTTQKADDYDCMDSERFATKGNADQERLYREMQSKGCCGSVDVELNCEDGSVLLYGFNFGH